MNSSAFFERALRIAACLCMAAAARAETGVTDVAIVIGQSAVFSGPVADAGNPYRSGIELYFNQVKQDRWGQRPHTSTRRVGRCP